MSTITTGLLPSDRENLYEVVNGERVELQPMGAKESGIANHLSGLIWMTLGKDPPGQVFVEMLFRLRTQPKLDRRPDVAYVPYAIWSDRVVPDTDAWEIVPALAAEIISKNNTAVEVQAKIEEYFQYGVKLVWVVYPQQQRIHVYRDPKTIQVLDADDNINGENVLPGFSCKVSEIFA